MGTLPEIALVNAPPVEVLLVKVLLVERPPANGLPANVLPANVSRLQVSLITLVSDHFSSPTIYFVASRG